VKTVRIAVLLSIGIAWAAATAQATVRVTHDLASHDISSAAVTMQQADVVATASANPPATAFIQWVVGDVTRVAVVLAWVAVAMLLAFVYDCARS